MTAPVADPSLYTDVNGLAALKRGARAQDPNALREAARQFESLFTKMMLKSMREASFGDPVFGSDQQKFYQGMFDDQLSVDLTKGHGLGLADMLIQQLTRAGLIPADAAKMGAGAASSQPMSATIARSGTVGVVGTSATSTGAAGAVTDKARVTRTLSPEEFVEAVWPSAEAAGNALGIDPRNLVAQAALETGWGRSVPRDANGNSSFNLFGVKAGQAWSGSAVAARTLEFQGGIPVPRTDKFRAYASETDSFNDYVALLRNNPRYAGALDTGSDTNAFATALQRGGYATDPAYAQKLVAIAQNVDGIKTALKSADTRPLNTTSTML